MSWHLKTAGWSVWRRQRQSAWGALLDRQEIMLAGLSLQKTGGMRVMVYEHLHAPQGLVHLPEGDRWLGQTLRSLARQLPATGRTLVLALAESRSRQGVLDWAGAPDTRRLQAEVQLEAAAAWGVGPGEVGFDFRLGTRAAVDNSPLQQVCWAACLREELQQWRLDARKAGWRLPMVETEVQAAQRALMHLRGDTPQHRADSARDWQFSSTPQRQPDEVDWHRLQGGPMWKSLVACGAALGALV
ncbi:MAG: hypothetical protein ACKOWC_08055 [Limnohabitans sp.]